MSEPTRFNGDGGIEVVGPARFLGSVYLPDEAIDDDAVAGDAGIDSSKLEHRFSPCLGQDNAVATAQTKVVHLARGAGTVLAFAVGAITAAVGDSTATVDLQKRTGAGAWSSLLTGTVTLALADTVGPKAGTLIGSPVYAADDQLRIVITVAAGTGTLPLGLYAQAELKEAAT
jgi:hypothetical protein